MKINLSRSSQIWLKVITNNSKLPHMRRIYEELTNLSFWNSLGVSSTYTFSGEEIQSLVVLLDTYGPASFSAQDSIALALKEIHKSIDKEKAKQ